MDGQPEIPVNRLGQPLTKNQINQRARDKRIADEKAKSLGPGAPYYAYIRSDAWREVKRRYLASGLSNSCLRCSAPYTPGFELHHKTYKRLGREHLTDLAMACRTCHQAIHDRQKRTGENLWAATKKSARRHRQKLDKNAHHPKK